MSSVGKVRRLLHLLERLQSGRIFNTKELSEFCGVSRRTTFRDLKVLQDSGLPILYDAEKQGYWLCNGPYLPPTDFTLEETLSLLILAQELGSKDRGVPYQDIARDAALKLQSNLPGEMRNYVGDYASSIRIQSEPLADLPHSKEHYERMIAAITEKRKVRISYHSLYDQKPINTLLSPYRLLFQRHTWYVIGRSSMHRAVRTFHLGRVQSSEMTTDSFNIPARFSIQRYLGNAWSLIRERGQRQQVTVRFQPLVAKNVAEVTWHPTQELNWNDDDSLDFTVCVDGIHEISWWVMGYGDQAEVVEPPALRDIISQRVTNMSRTYGLTKSDSKKKSANNKTRKNPQST